MSAFARSSFDPPRPTREQLQHLLAIAFGQAAVEEEPRPLSAYEPLAWLLRDDVGNQALRRTRRSLYRKLVSDLAREFDRIYGERLASSNGPWEFPDIYMASEQARKYVAAMRRCAWQHALRLPSAGAASTHVYRDLIDLLSVA